MEAAVRRIRSSRAARASTSASVAPGAANLIQNGVAPGRPRERRQRSRGNSRRARKRISGCSREYPLRAQRIAGICQTGDDVVVGDVRGTRQDIGLGPPVGRQTDDESTESRVPRITGLPASASAASMMRGCAVMSINRSDFSMLTILESAAQSDERIAPIRATAPNSSPRQAHCRLAMPPLVLHSFGCPFS